MLLNLFFAYYVVCAAITLFIESYLIRKQGRLLRNLAGYLVFCGIMGFLIVPLVYMISPTKIKFNNKSDKCRNDCKCKNHK